ncbi:hypothetical protein [Thermocoleostomius sinensis]|uniref:Uncharacterized protein n=1 Tax=Thermocoleostomius sinensis A174 TaxID=2016057 RepID=A0A9E8ZG62_9CYAN|nr:hypothetical protein [Thermocoleostomius sinensis]WAL60615.1 hypothetical protein OXH18_01055 [Thermocoleostomius sinensis A174]
MNKVAIDRTALPSSLQATLTDLATKLADRKGEVVDLLSGEQPAKSRHVDLEYLCCTWWEGCYYCQDQNQQWHRVKCFI